MRSSHMLINEPPLLILPSLAVRVGLNGAIFLQQLHFWSSQPNQGLVRDGRKWIRNNLDEWLVNFPFWSVGTLRRTIAKLESLGMIEKRDDLNREKEDRTLWYAVVYEKLNEPIDQIDQMPFDQIDQMPSNPIDQNDQLYYKTKTTIKTTDNVDNKLSDEILEFLGAWNKAMRETSPYATYIDPESGKKKFYKSEVRLSVTAANRNYEKKLATRLKSKAWRESWRTALDKAAQNYHLMTSNWFTPEYFLRNNSHVEKINSGVFDSFHESKLRQHKVTTAKQAKNEAGELLQQLKTAVSTFGYAGFPRAQEKLGRWNLKKISNDVAGGWRNLCSLQPQTINIKFYGALKDANIDDWKL